MENRKFKVFKIILFSVIIVVCLIIRFTDRNPNKDENITVDDIFKGSTLLKNNNTSKDSNDELDNQKYNNDLTISEYESNPDQELYNENPDDEIYGDEVFIKFRLLNGELLYDQKLPLGIFDKMLENYQEYFNELEVDAPISEVKIMEDSIDLSKDTLRYELLTDIELVISVEVDLNSFEYTFKNK